MLDRIKYSLTAVIISFAARVGLLISCFDLFVVSLLSLMDRVEHCRSPCWLLCCSLVCHLCVVCLGLFTLPIIVIDRLCSVNGGSTLTSVYYSRPSITRTLMACLPWLIRTRGPMKFFR